MSDHVVAVVPVYCPPAAVVENIAAVADQVARVIVVDDGSPPTPGLDEIVRSGADVIRLDANRGIAAALNAGVSRALEDPAVGFVLTLDQDSRVCERFVATALTRHGHAATETRVGIVAPGFVAGNAVPCRIDQNSLRIPWEPIQSGLVLSRETLESVGPFREEFVIDCVDTDFYLRARRSGYLTVLDDECRIEHALGGAQVRARGRGGISLHPPWRRYYMTRNRLAVLREHGQYDPAWARRSRRAEIVALILNLALGRRRLRQLTAVVAGIRDFRAGRFGKADDAILRRLHGQPSRLVPPDA